MELLIHYDDYDNIFVNSNTDCCKENLIDIDFRQFGIFDAAEGWKGHIELPI